MKYILALIALLALTLTADAQLTNGCVTFAWENPNSAGVVDATCIYHSTNSVAPFTNWVKVATGPGDATNAQVYIPPGVHFFTLTLSNAWGESPHCNIVGTPAQPNQAANLKITGLAITNSP